MATTMPKTIFITTLPAAGTNFVQCPTPAASLLSPKVGTKRPFSIVTSSPLTLNGSNVVVNKTMTYSPTTTTPAASMANANWLPATVQRSYKFEAVDEDYNDYGDDSSEDHSGNYQESDQPPRKRERLTHLTAEEKMFRRKMKNRIAAQTARDRKKALMIDLEETVRRLEEENDTLAVENSKLRQSQSSMAEENDRLKSMLAEQQKVPAGRDDARAVSAFGPAESINVPLPKEQAKSACALTWLVASALIQLYSECCVTSLPSEEQRRRILQLEQMKENGSLTLEEVISRSPPEAIEKLRTIIRSHRNSRPRPP